MTEFLVCCQVVILLLAVSLGKWALILPALGLLLMVYTIRQGTEL